MSKDIDGPLAWIVLTLLAQTCFILLHLGTEWHRVLPFWTHSAAGRRQIMFMARLRQSRRHKGVREVRITAPIIISLCKTSNMVAEALKDAIAKFMTSRVACCITVLEFRSSVYCNSGVQGATQEITSAYPGTRFPSMG